MNHDDLARCVVAFRGMFEVYGVQPSDERLRLYVDLLADIPIARLESAIRRAILDTTRKNLDFPPSPGMLMNHANSLRDEEYRRREQAETEARLRGPALPDVASEKCAACEGPAEVVRWGRDAEGLRALAEIRAYCRRCDPGPAKSICGGGVL